MSDYKYFTKWTAANQTHASDCLEVFGYEREILYITIHHWGKRLQNYTPARFRSICKYLASANKRMVSAHYVVERGKVACLIAPKHASWANGNAKGNAQSVTIECNPQASRKDKETIAQLIAELREAYAGKEVLVRHSYWTPTACPGKYNVFELDDMALAIQHGKGLKPVSGDPKPIKTAPKPEKKDPFRGGNHRRIDPSNNEPGRVTDVRSKPQKVGKAWKTLKINDLGHVSLIAGNNAGQYDAKASVYVHGLDVGEVLQLRFKIVDTKGKNKVIDYGRVQEIIGTTGGAYNVVIDAGDLPEGGRYRLRLEAQCFKDKKVTVDSVETFTHFWNP